jgi:FkbM family methyltransferase
LVDAVRDGIDNASIRRNWLPLSYADSEVELRGLLRHRSFLAGLRSGGYERYTKELICASLAPGTTVIDGGSHIGYFAQLAARYEPGLAKLIAFEPDPYNFAALRFNVARLDRHNVQARHSALADRTGAATFHVSSGTISSSLFRRPQRQAAAPTTWREVRVGVSTVDVELGELREPLKVVAKLDLEGAEPLALQGMQRTLETASSATLVVEVNPPALGDGGSSPPELVELIHGLGLSAEYIDESAKALCPVDDSLWQWKGNLYCVKSSSRAGRA